MIRPLPAEVSDLLREGSLCYLTARTPSGPHLTPLVYAVHDSRLWVTTSRRSVKAKAWRADPTVGGLVRAGERSLVFSGTVRTHDLLQPSTWIGSVRRSPTLTLAAAAFARRNARFFAGYAVDAPRIPLAWSPPGRVFSEVHLEAAAVVGDDRRRHRWGELGGTLRSRSAFRTPASQVPFDGVPGDVLQRVGSEGPASLAVEGPDQTVVLPARWTLANDGLYAVLDEPTMALAGAGATPGVALVADHASTWRARAMTGVMVRGVGTVYVMARLRSGRSDAEAVANAAGVPPDHAVVVSVEPHRVVWWSGWSSGTVAG